MTPEESLSRALLEVAVLVPHDPRWAEAFDRERERLAVRFGARMIEIRHFGSTAVPGLPAKPVIDLIAGVASMSDADALIPELCAFDYHYEAILNAGFSDRRWLLRHRNGHRTHQLHLVVHGGQAWRERLDFSARLRDDPALRAQYAQLKCELVTRVGRDRDAYNAGKEAFILGATRNTGPKAKKLGD